MTYGHTLLAATYILTELINDHLHKAQLVFPSGAAPIAVVSGAGAYNLGAFLPAGSRVRAKCMDSVGAGSIALKLAGHVY